MAEILHLATQFLCYDCALCRRYCAIVKLIAALVQQFCLAFMQENLMVDTCVDIYLLLSELELPEGERLIVRLHTVSSD